MDISDREREEFMQQTQAPQGEISVNRYVVRTVAALLGAAFFSELFIMSFLMSFLFGEGRPFHERLIGGVLDSSILLLLMTPVLYLVVYRPFRLQVGGLRRSAYQLAEAHAALETTDQEHTVELATAIKELQVELAHRKFMEADTRKNLLKSQAFRNMLERARDGIDVIDFGGNILDMNQAFIDTLGYTREELLGMNISNIVVDLNPAVLRQRLLKMRQEPHGPVLFERTLISKDGKLIPVEVSESIVEENGRGTVVCITRDITERKQAEEVSRKREEQYRSLFGNMLEGVALCKMWNNHNDDDEDDQPKDFVFLDVNSAFERLTGLKDVVGKRITEIIPGVRQTDQALFDVCGRVALTGKAEKVELFMKTLGMWFSISVYSQERGYFVAIFDVITERKRTEELIELQVQRLSALRDIDVAITASFDLGVTLSVLLQHVTAQLRVDAAAVLIMRRGLASLEFAAERGFRSRGTIRLRRHLREDYAGRAAVERQLIAIPNLAQAEPPPANADLITVEGFVSSYAVPLIVKGQVKGVLEVFHRSPLDPGQEWLDFLESLAGQAAIAIDNAELFQDLQRTNLELTLAYDATIEGWSRALDLRDEETEGHTQRVTELTMKLASSMGISEAEMVHLRHGALLHDIGKLGVPDNILLKPGPLTEDEWLSMRKHPQLARDMLWPIAFLRPALDIPYCHHEKWDGTGYPLGLKGEQIPLTARIFAVVDVWDALCSDRPYRAAWPKDRVREHILSLAGTHFDPRVVEFFAAEMDNYVGDHGSRHVGYSGV